MVLASMKPRVREKGDRVRFYEMCGSKHVDSNPPSAFPRYSLLRVSISNGPSTAFKYAIANSPNSPGGCSVKSIDDLNIFSIDEKGEAQKAKSCANPWDEVLCLEAELFISAS